MSLSGESVTQAWLEGRTIDPLFGDPRSNGFGAKAHPDTQEGMEGEALIVEDASSSLEYQYALALGYNPAAENHDRGVPPNAVPYKEHASMIGGRVVNTVDVKLEALAGAADEILVGPYQRKKQPKPYATKFKEAA